MTFCPNCGAPIEYKIPPGDDRKRNVCSATGEIFYANPRNVVGCIVEDNGAILMCRRAIEPRRGFWTLPAGFLELGETTWNGAARETFEETRAAVEKMRLFAMIDVTHIGQVHIFYRARMAEPGYSVGRESQAVAFVHEHEIDWRQLAFPSIYRVLEHYFADRVAAGFGLHIEALTATDWQAMRLAATPKSAAGNC
jgi:ADP-ribose pyrophosphatase YjhB (NUDIX family)